MSAPMSYTEMAMVIENLPFLLKEKRRAKGLSVRKAAVEIGIDFNTLYRIEAGKEYNVKQLSYLLVWMES